MSLFIIRDMGFKDINPVSAGYEQANPSYSYHPAERDYYMLHYVVSGKGVLLSNGEKYLVNSGNVFLIKPDDDAVYTSDEKDPWYYIWVDFNGEQAKRLETISEPVFKTNGTVFEQIKNCLAYGDMRETYLASCIMLLLCNIFEKPGNLERIMSITRYIDTHTTLDLKVENIAAKYNLNRKYLSRIFKAETGISLQQYIVDAKMNSAKIFMKNNYSVCETAELLGYSDQAAFSRAYKKYHGHSPSLEKKARPTDGLSQYSRIIHETELIISRKKKMRK